MLHRHMTLNGIAADNCRVARRQLARHTISRLYGGHVRAVLDSHIITRLARDIRPSFAAAALGIAAHDIRLDDPHRTYRDARCGPADPAGSGRPQSPHQIGPTAPRRAPEKYATQGLWERRWQE